MSQLVKKIRTDQGDLQIDYNALANLPTISNPNLLINGDFQIWQRGIRFSNIANSYSSDRWMIKNAVASTAVVEKSDDTPSGQLMAQSMYIKETSNENTNLRYNFEKPLNGTYTLSFWYKSTAPISSYIYDNGRYVKLTQVEASSVWKQARVYFSATSVTFINVIHTMNIGEYYITGVKLEVGTVATQFVPRLYSEELALCQRYYEKRAILFFPMGCATPSTYYLAVNGGQHFVQKRVNPTVTVGAFFDNGGLEVTATVSVITCSIDGMKAILFSSECEKPVLNSTIEFDAEIY